MIGIVPVLSVSIALETWLVAICDRTYASPFHCIALYTLKVPDVDFINAVGGAV